MDSVHGLRAVWPTRPVAAILTGFFVHGTDFDAIREAVRQRIVRDVLPFPTNAAHTVMVASLYQSAYWGRLRKSGLCATADILRDAEEWLNKDEVRSWGVAELGEHMSEDWPNEEFERGLCEVDMNILLDAIKQ